MQAAPTRTLLAAYRRADAQTIERGRRWYCEAERRMTDLATETGYTVEQAVAVLAITSPGAQLVSNIRWTEEALRSQGTARVGRFPNTQGPKIQAVLASPEAAADFVRGPKVNAFHRAILGDVDALVLDRWAFYVAGHEDRDTVPGLGVRAKCERAYRKAAQLTGETVRDFQAIVWIAVRESQGIRYADIV